VDPSYRLGQNVIMFQLKYGLKGTKVKERTNCTLRNCYVTDTICAYNIGTIRFDTHWELRLDLMC